MPTGPAERRAASVYHTLCAAILGSSGQTDGQTQTLVGLSIVLRTTRKLGHIRSRRCLQTETAVVMSGIRYNTIIKLKNTLKTDECSQLSLLHGTKQNISE